MAIVLNPELDLILEKEVDVTPTQLWHAWTTPEHLKKWFCPLPWKTVDCEIDLRLGGIFKTVMESPEGQQFPGTGCYIEIVPNHKLTWTNALLPGFRPAESLSHNPEHECSDLIFTASIVLTPTKLGTQYTAYVMHQNAKARQRHEEMGFAQGWSAVLDQLVAEIKRAG